MNLFECSKNLLINVHNLEKSNNFLVFFLLLFLITGNIKKKKKIGLGFASAIPLF